MPKGLTLIELLVILIIVGILSAISIPIYRDWIKKVGIENDTRSIFSILNEAKARSFAEKRVCGIIFNGNIIELKCDTNADDNITDETTIINKIRIKNNFIKNFSGGVSYIKFSENGTASIIGNIHAADISTNPSYSCINISLTRIKIGKWDGSSCNIK